MNNDEMALFSGKKLMLASLCGLALLAHKSVDAQVVTYYDNNVIVDLSVLEDNGFRAAPSFGIPSNPAAMPPVGQPQSQFFGLPQGSQPSAPSVPTSSLNVPVQNPQSRIMVQTPNQPSRPAAPVLEAPQMAKPVLPSDRMVKSEPQRPVSAPVQLVEKPKTVTPPRVSTPVVEAKPMRKPDAPVIVEVQKPTPVMTPAPAPKPAPAPVVEVKPAPKPAPKPVVETVKVEKPRPAPALTPSAPAVTETVEKVEEAAVAPTPVSEPSVPAPAEVMAEAPPPPPVGSISPREVTSTIKQEAEENRTGQVAALTPSGPGSARISFDPGLSQFPPTARGELEAMAASLKANPDDRVQLLAYAGGENLSASKARRLSLSRALSVRTFLIEEGVRSTRIDVRALGNKTTEEPLNRVDIQITPR